METTHQVTEVQKHYDRITEGWRLILGEDLHWGVFRSADDDLEAATVHLTDLMADFETPRQVRALDVGCGVGGPARHLAETRGWHVTGISISPVGIEAATEQAKASGLTHLLDFRVADAMDLNLPDASFDVVWVMESSHLMPDKARLLSECQRVVKPGGTVALCDLMLNEPLSWRRVATLQEDLSQLEKSFGIARLDTLDEYQSLFTAAGLADIQTQDVGELVVPTIDAWEQNIQAERERLDVCFDDGRLEDFLESCQILRRLFASEGWGYGIVRGRK